MSTQTSPNTSRPGPRPRHTREQVLAAALVVIDRDGPELFSMRRIADELGMGAMTLYGYVRNKEEVVEGVTALAFAEVHRKTPMGSGWEERLRSEVEDLHALCQRHPNLVALVLGQTSASPGLFRLRERMLGALLGAGFDETTALFALGVLTSYALGFGGTQAGHATIDLPERIRELPAGDFPNLSDAADRYAMHLSEQAFEYGLELLLSGLRADLRSYG
jgi:AcrR family transcriptional regulator